VGKKNASCIAYRTVRVASLAFYAGIHTKTGHIVFREIGVFYGTKQK